MLQTLLSRHESLCLLSIGQVERLADLVPILTLFLKISIGLLERLLLLVNHLIDKFYYMYVGILYHLLENITF